MTNVFAKSHRHFLCWRLLTGTGSKEARYISGVDDLRGRRLSAYDTTFWANWYENEAYDEEFFNVASVTIGHDDSQHVQE